MTAGGFAVVGFEMAGERPDVDAVLFLETTGGGAKTLATGLKGGVETFLGPWETVDVGGRAVQRKDARPLEVFLWHGDDRLVLTTKRARMEGVLAGLHGAPAAESLATSARYRTVVERMGARQHAMLVYADAKRIVDRGVAIARQHTRGGDVDEFVGIWRALGLDALEAVAFADIPSGDGFRTELALTMTERRGVLGIPVEGRPTQRFAAHAPRNCLLYGAEHVDLAGMWVRVLDLVGSLDADARAEMEEGERMANAALGVDLRRDVVGSLGTEWAVSLAQPPGGGLIPDLALFIEVKDRARLEAALETVLKRLQGMAAEEGAVFKVAEAEWRGHRIRFVEMAERDGDPIPVAPAWALGDDRLVLALYPQTVKHALMEKPALPSHDEYKALLRRVPDTAVSTMYVDAGGMIGWLYNSAVPLLQVVQGGMHVHAAPFGLRLNMQDLFTADLLARHLGGCMTYTAVEKDCIRMGYVSDFGIAGLIVPAAMLAGAAGVAYMRLEAAPAEIVAPMPARAHREREAERRAENAMLRQRLAEIERQLAELKRLLEEDGGEGR